MGTRRETKVAATEGDESLEEKIAAMQQQLQEEIRIRTRQEEALADMEQQIQEFRVEAKKVSSECELTNGGDQIDPEQVELDMQLQELQQNAANPQDIDEEDIGKLLLSEIEKVKEGLAKATDDTSKLEENQ